MTIEEIQYEKHSTYLLTNSDLDDRRQSVDRKRKKRRRCPGPSTPSRALLRTLIRPLIACFEFLERLINDLQVELTSTETIKKKKGWERDSIRTSVNHLDQIANPSSKEHHPK